MDKLIMQFLGTGAAEGIPSPFCRCRVCENARKVKGKEILLRKAYKEPKFHHKTVLTHDTWRYVDIFLLLLQQKILATLFYFPYH